MNSLNFVPGRRAPLICWFAVVMLGLLRQDRLLAQGGKDRPVPRDTALHGQVVADVKDWKPYSSWVVRICGFAPRLPNPGPPRDSSEDVFCYRMTVQREGRATLWFLAVGYEVQERVGISLADTYGTAILPAVKLRPIDSRQLVGLSQADVERILGHEAAAAIAAHVPDIFLANVQYREAQCASDPSLSTVSTLIAAAAKRVVAKYPVLSGPKLSARAGAYESMAQALVSPFAAEQLGPNQTSGMVEMAMGRGKFAGTSDGVRANCLLALTRARLEGEQLDKLLSFVRAEVKRTDSNLYRPAITALAVFGTKEEQEIIKDKRNSNDRREALAATLVTGACKIPITAR